MARDNEGQSKRDAKNRIKRYKRRRRLIITILFIILLCGAGAYLYHLYNRNYQNYEVVNTIESTGEGIIGYLSYGSAIIKYSRDGAEAIGANGSRIWNGSYEMKEPIVDTCGEYAVIADKGGKTLKIFDKGGTAGSITTLYDIVKVEIARQGVVAVLMKENKTNYIYLYDVDGTILVDKATDVNKNGYPIDMSLSNDGEKLVISYLSVTQGELVSTVAFFNFGEVGQNYTDRFVGGYEFNDTIVPRVTFLNNNTVCVYKENGFLLYAMDEIPNLVHEEKFEENIRSILYNDNYAGIVVEGEGTQKNKLLLYDLSGGKVLERKLDFDYHTIFLAKEEVIMYDNLTCIILKTNGKKKFEYNFDGNITALYPINNIDRYFLIGSSGISEISLVE